MPEPKTWPLPDVAVHRTGNRIHTEHYVHMIDAYPQTIRRRMEELAEELAFTAAALAAVEREEATDPTPVQVLDLQARSRDCQELTIRERLIDLLAMVWEQREGFNGKRPWGESDWPWDFYQPMADAGFIADVADEKWGGTTIPDDQKAKGDRLIAGAIEALRVPEGTENPDA